MNLLLLTLVAAGPTSAPWLPHLPHGQSIGPLLEQVTPEVVLGVEESGGFAEPDALRPSILGDSWSWTAWYLDGLDLTCPLDSGRPALTVPFPLLAGMELGLGSDPDQALPTGLFLRTAELPASTVGVGWGSGQVGDLSPGALALTRLFSTTHPRDRLRAPPAERRGPRSRLTLWAFDRTEGTRGTWLYGVEAQLGERQFLTFKSPDGAFTGLLPEPWARATAFLRLVPTGRPFTATVLAEARVRQHLYAEQGYGPDETQGERRLGLHVAVTGGDTRLGFTFTHAHTEALPNFSRELLDPDGQGLFPFGPAGDRLGLNADVFQGLGPAYLHLNHKAEARSPERPRSDHTLTYGGAPYGRWVVEAETSAQLVGNHQLGVKERVTLGELALTFELYGNLAYGLHESGGNDLFIVDVGANAGGRYRGWSFVEPFFELARTPAPLTPEVVAALDRVGTKSTLGLGPTGRIYDTRGGAFVEVDPDLLPTNVTSALIGLDFPGLGPFRFTAKGRLKHYENPVRLAYLGAATEVIDGVAYLRPGEKRYQLQNRPEQRPLYFGLELLLQSEAPERYLFQAGFLAYTAVGVTAFGNGALANDLGVLDPSSAHPNADRLGLASVDGDRAFVTKVVYAHHLLDGLWASATLRHKDGQPFAFLDAHPRGEQVAFTYSSNRGSPLQYSRPLAGPREDFQINLDASLSYALNLEGLTGQATLSVFNLWDLGNTLQEVSGDLGKNGRVALEAQLPRTVFLSLELRP